MAGGLSLSWSKEKRRQRWPAQKLEFPAEPLHHPRGNSETLANSEEADGTAHNLLVERTSSVARDYSRPAHAAGLRLEYSRSFGCCCGGGTAWVHAGQHRGGPG